MSSYEGRCPRCGGLMNMRNFLDGGKDGDINQDFWCSACKLRWTAMDGPPMEAET